MTAAHLPTADAPAVPPRRPIAYARVLTAGAAVAAVLGLPYALALTPPAPGPHPPGTWVLAVALAVGLALQVLLTYGVVRFGLRVGPMVGLAWPPAPGWDAGGDVRRLGLRSALGIGAGVGAALGLVLEVAVRAQRGIGVVPLRAVPHVPPWAAALGSVGAGVTEELWFRLGAMTLAAWVATRLLDGFDRPRQAGRPASPARVWGANAAAALLFGAAHLPQAADYVVVNGALVAYVLGANGLVGLACGWLYWRRGLAAAMACHAAVDLVLKVLLPAALRAHG